MIDIIVKRPSLSPPLKWQCISLAPTLEQIKQLQADNLKLKKSIEKLTKK